MSETTTEDLTVDCRSPEGVTIGLIDGIITAARVLATRDLEHPQITEALHDLTDDEDVARLMRGVHSTAATPSSSTPGAEAHDGTGEAQESRE